MPVAASWHKDGLCYVHKQDSDPSFINLPEHTLCSHPNALYQYRHERTLQSQYTITNYWWYIGLEYKTREGVRKEGRGERGKEGEGGRGDERRKEGEGGRGDERRREGGMKEGRRERG